MKLNWFGIGGKLKRMKGNLLPWQNKYPDTLSFPKIPEDETLLSFVENAIVNYARRIAFRDDVNEYSYSDVGKRADALAQSLRQRGARAGDKIAIMMPNGMEFIVSVIASLKLGLVLVLVNPLYSARELSHQLRDSEAKWLIASKEASLTWGSKNIISQLSHILTDGDYKGVSSDCVSSLLEGMSYQADSSAVWHRPHPDDPALIQYTGGTTGVSKGAILSNRNLISNHYQMKSFLDFANISEEDRILTALPLYHIFAFAVNFLYFFKHGCSNTLVRKPGSGDELSKAFKVSEPTILTGVNTLYAALLNKSDLSLENIKLAIGGGAPVLPKVSEEWFLRTGSRILEGYGLSETSPVVTLNPPWRTEYRLGIGIPLPLTEVYVCDEAGQHLNAGEVGEICVRGPQVMSGYYGRQDITDEVFFEGDLFRTGDIGFMEADGQFVISDRKKDMIIVSGFNVFPNEIESVVSDMPGILECACVGLRDELGAEKVALFYVVKEGVHLEKETIKQYCYENLAAYKVPKILHELDTLPKSAVGKILRRELNDFK